MIPAPHTLHVRRWSDGGGTDPHGNPLPGQHGAPEALPVHGYAPGASREAVEAGRNTTEIAWTVYAPAGTQVAAEDLVVLGGVEYEVVGDSLDWAKGPWLNPVAGVVIELRKQRG